MDIKLLVEAAAMKPSPALSQKLGPLGINLGKVIAEVNKSTQEFKGMKLPVILTIDGKTKAISVKPLTPPASELLKKEINVKKGSPVPNKLKIANIPIETIIKVAKIKEKDMITNNFKTTVRTVVGSCVSLGILIESKEPAEVLEEIGKGTYDKEIESKNENASEEKLSKLNEDFEEVKKSQASIEKEIEEKRAKAAEAAAAAGGAAPAAGEAKSGADKAKPAEKKPAAKK